MSDGPIDPNIEVQRELGRRHGRQLGAGFDRDLLSWTVKRYEGIERTQAYEHAHTAAALGALRERLAEMDAAASGTAR